MANIDTETPDGEALRQELEDALAHAIAEVRAAMAKLAEVDLGQEASPEFQELAMLLTQLSAEHQAVSTAAPGSLPRLSRTSGTSLGSVSQVVQSATTAAAAHQIEYLAELSATELHAIQVQHDRDRGQYLAFEQMSLSRIETLASAQGLDMTGYQQTRNTLEAERAAAEAAGNRVETYRLDAVIAGHTVHGLRAVGAEADEIAKAEEARREARERYLKERAIDALAVGRAKGLSGTDLTHFVAGDQQAAATDLDETDARLQAEVANQFPEISAPAVVTQLAQRESSWERAARAAEGVLTSKVSDGAPAAPQSALRSVADLPPLPNITLDLSATDELLTPPATPRKASSTEIAKS